MYPDRVITIKGTVENMVAAEAQISSKLRDCIERDSQVCWINSVPLDELET